MNAKAPHNSNLGSKKLQLRVNPVTQATVNQLPTPSSNSSKNKGKTLALAKIQQHMNVAPPQPTSLAQQQQDLLTRPSLTLNSTKNKNSQREWQALLMQQKARSTKNSKKDGDKATKEQQVPVQVQIQQAKKASFFTGNIQIAPVQELQRAISNDHAPEIRSSNIHYKEGSTDARIFTCAMANKQRSQNQTVQHQQLRISKKSPTARVTNPNTHQQLLLNQKATKTISPVNIAALQDSGDEIDGKRSKKVIEVINIRKRYEVDPSRLEAEDQKRRKGLHNQPAQGGEAVLNVTTAAQSAQKNKQRTSSDTKIKKMAVARASQQQQPQLPVKNATIRSKGSSNHSTKQANQPCSSVGSGNNTVAGPKSSLQQNAQNLRARLASKSNERGEGEMRTKITTAPTTGRNRANNAAPAELQRVNKTSTRVKKQALQIFAQTKASCPSGKVTKNLYLGEDEISSPQKMSNSSTKNLINKSFQFNSSHHTNTAEHVNDSFGGSGTGSNPPPQKTKTSNVKATNGPQIKIKTTHNTQTYALAQPTIPYTCQAAEEKGIFFQPTPVEKIKEPGLKVTSIRQQKGGIKDLKTSKRIISSGSGPRTSNGISEIILNIAPPSMDMKKHQTVPFSTQNIRLVNEQQMLVNQRDISQEQQSLEKAKQVVKRPKKFNFGSLKNVQQIPEDEGEQSRKEKLNSSQERKITKQPQFKVMAENKNTNSNASISQTRKSISAKKTTSLKQPTSKNVAMNSVQKTTSKILLEDTRPVQNVGRGAMTTKECYKQSGFLQEVTQSADEAPANEQECDANKSFDMARFRMHYENRTQATSLVVAPKKLQTKRAGQKQSSTSTDAKGKILREEEQHTLAAIVRKLKMENKSDVGKNQYAKQHHSPPTDQENNHLKSQQSYKPKPYTTTQLPPGKVNNLSSSDFGDDSFTFSSLVHLQAKLDEHDMSGYAASQSASGTYQVKAKVKQNQAVVQKLSGELIHRDNDIKKLISELQNRDTVIHSLKEEMGMLVDQIKQGEQKREKSKERIKSLICKVESKLQKFTHLTDLNNCQLQQLRQLDSSRKNTESDQDDSQVLSTKSQPPVTIKLKNIRPSNKTPTIQPSNKSSFVAGVLSRLGDTKEEETKQLDLLATKSKENNRAATEINIGSGSLHEPALKRTFAISKLNLQQLRQNQNSSMQESPMTIAEFTESQLTLPMGTLQSSNSQKQFSTNSWNQNQDSLEASLVTVAQCSFTAEDHTEDIIRQLNGGVKKKRNGVIRSVEFEQHSEGVCSNEQSLIQLEHEWERAQRELAKQSEQVRSLLKPPTNNAKMNNFFQQAVGEEKKNPQMYLQLDKLSRTEKLVDLNQIDEHNGDVGEVDGHGGMQAFYLGDGKVTSRFGGRQATNESQDEADQEAAVITSGKSKPKDAPFSKTMSKGNLQKKRFNIQTPQELQQVENSQPAQCYGLLANESTQVKTTKARPKGKMITRSKERSQERSFDNVQGAMMVKRQEFKKPIQMIKRQSKSPNDPTSKFLLQKSFDYAKQQEEENSPRQTRPRAFRQGGQGQGNQISLNSTSEVEKSRDTSALKKQMLMMAALKAQNNTRQQNAKQGDVQQKEKAGQTKLRLHVLKTNANACTTAQTVKNSQNVVKLTRQLDDEAQVPITGGKNTPTSRKSKHIIN